MSQIYLQIHSISNTMWNKKIVFDSTCLHQRVRQQNEAKRKLVWTTIAPCYHLVYASPILWQSQRTVFPSKLERIFNRRFARHRTSSCGSTVALKYYQEFGVYTRDTYRLTHQVFVSEDLLKYSRKIIFRGIIPQCSQLTYLVTSRSDVVMAAMFQITVFWVTS